VSAEPYVPTGSGVGPGHLSMRRGRAAGARPGRPLAARHSAASGTAAVCTSGHAHPIAKLAVRNMAVMAAWYKAESGLRRLPR
jgi:hypothetical protein